MAKYDLEKPRLAESSFGFRAVSVLFGGFLCHLALGAMYISGNFSPYIISYIRNRTDDTTTRNVDASWLPIVGIPGNSIGMTGGGLLDIRFGPQVATLIGTVIFCGSILLTSFTVRKSLIGYLFSYGCLVAFGMPCAYGPPIQTAMKWFPNHAGFVGGIVLSGFGGGAMIFNQVLTMYVNPDNLSPDFVAEDGERYFTDPDLLDRVPWAFMLLGGIYLVMLLIGIAFIRAPPVTGTCDLVSVDPAATAASNPADLAITDTSRTLGIGNGTLNGEILDTSDTPAVGNGKVNGEIKPHNEANTSTNVPRILSAKESVKLALKTRSFYIIWCTMLGVIAGMNMFITLYKAYGQTFINDDHFLALIGSLASVFNCIGRPIWGLAMDKFGFKVVIRLMTLALSVLIGTILLTENWDKMFFMVWICAMYFAFCGIWSITPTALSKLFGAQNMAVQYGFIFTAISAGNTIASVSALTLKDQIGWHGLFIISTCLAALPFFLSFFFNGKDLSGRRI